MIVVTVVASLVCAGCLVALIVPMLAPWGYQDASGFHYGTPGSRAAATETVAQPV